MGPLVQPSAAQLRSTSRSSTFPHLPMAWHVFHAEWCKWRIAMNAGKHLWYPMVTFIQCRIITTYHNHRCSCVRPSILGCGVKPGILAQKMSNHNGHTGHNSKKHKQHSTPGPSLWIQTIPTLSWFHSSHISSSMSLGHLKNHWANDDTWLSAETSHPTTDPSPGTGQDPKAFTKWCATTGISSSDTPSEEWSTHIDTMVKRVGISVIPGQSLLPSR